MTGAFTWCLVAPAVVEGSSPIAATRVVTYDRAGLGWPALAAHEDRVWRRLQADQATRSTRGRLVVAPGSDHCVQLADQNPVINLVQGSSPRLGHV